MRGGNRRVVTGTIRLAERGDVPTTAWLREGRTIALFERVVADPEAPSSAVCPLHGADCEAWS
jgi:hypothetical protein